jgi:hypothetical protein
MSQEAAFRIGWALCLLLGLAFLATVVTFAALPSVFHGDHGYGAYFEAVAAGPALEVASWWARAFVELFVLGAVMAVSDRVKPFDRTGLVRYTSAIAYLGFAVFALERFKLIGTVPHLAEAYVLGSDSVQGFTGGRFPAALSRSQQLALLCRCEPVVVDGLLGWDAVRKLSKSPGLCGDRHRIGRGHPG